MTNKTFSRRKFLKLSAFSLSALAFSPDFNGLENSRQHRLMRVGSDSVSIHSQPNEESRILYQRYRDDLINVYYEVKSEYGPEYNPIWYRVWGGYVHRAQLVEVEYVLNETVSDIREEGQLGELTVPFIIPIRYPNHNNWIMEDFRFYFESTHWVRDVVQGPDGRVWYIVEDQLSKTKHMLPGEFIRLIPDSEFSPIAPDIQNKRIEISIANQVLKAFEGTSIVLETKISSGQLRGDLQTPSGEFRIGAKYPSKHMPNDLWGVPWCCFFELEKGIATHGTYWHNNFGVPTSHGCINMRNSEAKWLFRWTNPVASPEKERTTGFGTRIIIS